MTTDARERAIYQPNLGRFLSRDPLSATGVDVLTDTGFYAERLATMRANPWFFGGNWEHPYVYARNNPVNLVDPSGEQWAPPVAAPVLPVPVAAPVLPVLVSPPALACYATAGVGVGVGYGLGKVVCYCVPETA